MEQSLSLQSSSIDAPYIWTGEHIQNNDAYNISEITIDAL